MAKERQVLRVPKVMVDRIKEVITDSEVKNGVNLNQIQAMEIIAVQSKRYGKK